MESFGMVQKVSVQSGEFWMIWKNAWMVLTQKLLDDIESFWMGWRVSGQSRKFPDGLDGNFPDDLESFRWSQKFTDGLESLV